MNNKLKNIVSIVCLLCIFISVKELNATDSSKYKGVSNLITKGNWTFVQLRPRGIFSRDFDEVSSSLSFLPETLDRIEKEQNVEIKDYKIMHLDLSNHLSYWLLIHHTPK